MEFHMRSLSGTESLLDRCRAEPRIANLQKWNISSELESVDLCCSREICPTRQEWLNFQDVNAAAPS